MPSSTAQTIIIIGAGIVGANLADELLSLGHPASAITVIEQGPLTFPGAGGSTSHAPGLVFQTSPSKTMTRFAQYTVQKLQALRRDGQGCFNPVGGLEIATTPERVQEIKRRYGFARSWGVEGARLLDAQQCREMYPLLNQDDGVVLGGLFVASDGLALAARATELLIERTRARGVRYLAHTTVTGIEKDAENRKVTGVRIKNHETALIAADVVVACAGFWGVEVGALAGVEIPLLPLAHQYATTTPVAEHAHRTVNTRINGWNARLPILRHQDHDLYYREHGDRYGIGFYGHKPMPAVVAAAAAAGRSAQPIDEKNMPSRLEFTANDFAPAWTETQRLLPALRGAEIEDGFNGIFSFTPDGGPLIGQAPHLDGFYAAEAVWVTHSAGVARAVAQLITQGWSDIDALDCELARFEPVQLTRDYVSETAQQNFVEIYDILHPLQPRTSPRNLRTGPFYARQKSLGAFFLETGGWERPFWYESNAALLHHALPAAWQPPRPGDPWSQRFTSPISAVEAWKTRTAVALYDLTSFHRFLVFGPGALGLLQQLTTSDMDVPPGTVLHTLCLTPDAGIRTDLFVTRLDRTTYQIGANTATDLAYLTRAARHYTSSSPQTPSIQLHVHVQDITDATCALGLWGPRALDVIRSLNPTAAAAFHPLTLPHMHATPATLASIPVLVTAKSPVGESGWKIQSSAAHGARLWDALLAAGAPHGLIPAGRAAFNALRLEKGMRVCGVDMTSEHDPDEAGMGFAVDGEKQGDFVGRAALMRRRESRRRNRRQGQRVERRLRCLMMDEERSMVMGKEPVYVAGGSEPVGYVTTAALGYSVGRPVAYAWLPGEVAEGAAVEIEYFGERVRATVVCEPVYDPEGRKLMGELDGVSGGGKKMSARL